MCLIPHISTYKSGEVDYWKLMGLDEPYLEWVSYMRRTMIKEYLVLSRNVSLSTKTYCMPELEQGPERDKEE